LSTFQKNHFVYWKNLTLFSQMFFHRFNFNFDSSIRLIPGPWSCACSNKEVLTQFQVTRTWPWTLRFNTTNQVPSQQHQCLWNLSWWTFCFVAFGFVRTPQTSFIWQIRLISLAHKNDDQKKENTFLSCITRIKKEVRN
jgi:hypothetical protein